LTLVFGVHICRFLFAAMHSFSANGGAKQGRAASSHDQLGDNRLYIAQ